MSDTAQNQLREFVAGSTPATLDLLVSYLAGRADEYVETSRAIPVNGSRALKRANHHLSMAQALFALADRINQEKEELHGPRPT